MPAVSYTHLDVYKRQAQMYLYDVMKKSGQRTCAVIVVLFVVTLLISACAFFIQRKKERGTENGVH